MSILNPVGEPVNLLPEEVVAVRLEKDIPYWLQRPSFLAELADAVLQAW